MLSVFFFRVSLNIGHLISESVAESKMTVLNGRLLLVICFDSSAEFLHYEKRARRCLSMKSEKYRTQTWW
jgi:hypothetical protein